jgi:hypothetical protein
MTYIPGNLAASQSVGSIIDGESNTSINRNVTDFNYETNTSSSTFATNVTVRGINDSVGSGSIEPIWETGISYVPLQTADNLRIESGGNVADGVAGAGALTIEVTFLNASFAEVTETITTAGSSASASTTSTAIRLLFAKVLTVGTYNGSNIGDIIIETNGGVELGIIKATKGRMFNGQYTVPASKIAYITQFYVSVCTTNTISLYLYSNDDANDATQPKKLDWSITDYSGITTIKLNTYLRYTANTDIILEAIKMTGDSTASVVVSFDMILTDA